MTASADNRRLLVVDDHRPIHDDFRKIFAGAATGAAALDHAEAALLGGAVPGAEAPGFEIDSAFQGEEAVARAAAALAAGRPYAFAFVDVRMPPGIDGVETTARLWRTDPDLQVVICTAFSDFSLDEMLARLGESDRLLILRKPFDNIEVLQMANALAAKWRLVRENRRHVVDLESRVAERTREIDEARGRLQAEIDERNRMEVQLRHAQKLESIGQLAAGIAHEINTPTQYIGDNTHFLQDAFGELGGVIAAVRALGGSAAAPPAPDRLAELRAAADRADLGYLQEEIPKAIQQSLEGVGRVAKIVRAMKEFSHPGSAEKTPVDLNRAIESTLTVATNEWKYVARLETDFAPALPPVPLLPGEFNQVVLNLVVNAAHAIAEAAGPRGEKGVITVATRRDGDWAEVHVGDTGTGIPEHVRGRIFEPFFTTKGVGKGSGQGLAIARSVVVDKHGGTIAFETTPGRGTTFVVRLPLAPSAAPAS
jgi:two-component system NtrC family sensor kinase